VARKRQEDEVQEGAAWLTSYADMVTLLFVFFVLMFAISSIDNEKFKLVFMGIQGALTEEKFMAIKYPPDADDGAEGNTIIDPNNPPEFPKHEDHTIVDPMEDGEDEDDEESKELAALYQKLKDYLIENDMHQNIFLHEGEGQGDRLLMTIPSDVGFASGSADVNPLMYAIAVDLAKLIRETHDAYNPFNIVVSGHTDNVPQNSPQFPNNWWLSSGRANNFLGILIDESGLSSSYFYAKSYGEEMPLGMPEGGNIDEWNQTDEQRAKNRRVEIMISQDRQVAQQRRAERAAAEAEAREAAAAAAAQETKEEPLPDIQEAQEEAREAIRDAVSRILN